MIVKSSPATNTLTHQDLFGSLSGAVLTKTEARQSDTGPALRLVLRSLCEGGSFLTPILSGEVLTKTEAIATEVSEAGTFPHDVSFFAMNGPLGTMNCRFPP